MTKPLGISYWRLWIASAITNFGDGISIVAYPWLASAVTRNPLHIALVGVATRLPWLLLSLPAGVVTDRVDRRRLVVLMDSLRFLITLGVAAAVLLVQADLASPDEIAAGAAQPPPSAGLLLVVIYAAALLLGCAEVFRDNAAQTLMPAIVDKVNLERANGRLWGAEMVMNSFAGPPAGGFLLAIGFALPFFVDAATFAASAALIFTIAGRFRPIAEPSEAAPPGSFTGQLKEGVRWLWSHRLFRPMAIALGVMNGMNNLATATYVLFVQEVLLLNAAAFGALMTAGAAGGLVGSLAAAGLARRLGQGPSLFVSVLCFAIATLITGLASSFWLVWLMFAVISFMAMLWNVITVSLRQALIPDRLLGRVNSVYRFLGWGSIPLGALLGGVVVAISEGPLGREWALRAPFIVAAVVQALLFVYVRPRLGSAQIAEAQVSS
ncbi:MAG TPA: MFS transporter [Acidimicrobiia bacterium]|nr:MFS transporter [Acidimicrobiia bacterium]